MPDTEPHTRVRCTGTIGASSSPYEIFDYGFAIGSTSGDPIELAEQDSISGAVDVFHKSGGMKISNRCRLRDVKFQHIGADGSQDEPTVHYPYNSPGDATAGQRPSQVALAVSFRGPAAVHPVRGRFYVPTTEHTLDVDTGLIALVDAQAAADAARTLVDAVNTIMGALGFFAVVSKGDAVPVEEVRVGRVLDTIRSRRNAPLEGYVVGV